MERLNSDDDRKNYDYKKNIFVPITLANALKWYKCRVFGIHVNVGELYEEDCKS